MAPIGTRGSIVGVRSMMSIMMYDEYLHDDEWADDMHNNGLNNIHNNGYIRAEGEVIYHAYGDSIPYCHPTIHDDIFLC